MRAGHATPAPHAWPDRKVGTDIAWLQMRIVRNDNRSQLE